MTTTNALATAIVTGGQGLIGNAIVGAIQRQGTALSAGRGTRCDMQVDLASQMPDFSQAAGGSWIHAAGVTDEECAATPETALIRAALQTQRMIDAAINAGIEKFVYVSSAHVYGPLTGTLDETSPVNPVSLYAQCHFLAEQAFRQCAARHRKPVLILRPCAVYGLPVSIDSFTRWSLIPYEFPRNAVARQKIEIRSTGLQSRNFVSTSWVAEKVRIFLQDAQQDITSIINPVGADDITVREFALRCKEAYQRVTDKRCDVSWVEPFDSPSAADFRYHSIHADAVARISQLDTYLYDILTRLEQHAH